MSTSTTVYDRFLNPGDRNCIVSKLIVSASGTVTTTTDMPNIFHWWYYLVLEPGQSQNRSVIVDMQPVDPPIGVMIVSSKQEAASTAMDKIELPILTRGGTTVGQILAVFIEHRMHCYKFDDSGSGCLYWIFACLRLLERDGLIEYGAVDKLETFHKEQAESHPERHPMPLRKGVFY